MNDNAEQTKRESATECLIRVMEAFGKDEPIDILVVYKTTSGRAVCDSNDVNDIFQRVGMLECAKVASILYGVNNEVEDELEE